MTAVPPTREQVQELLDAHDWGGQQRVPLPHGLATPGADKSPTAALVLPESLDGRSVLDVGCALGYFCFEAERRGAGRVVGIERKRRRHRQSKALAELVESGVEFRMSTVGELDESERFDLVLALNLIHHLSDPFTAIERFARIARWRLVIEFPTLRDPVFRKHSGVRFARLLNRWPLVGVTPARKTYSTLYFSPPALRRYLRGRRDLGIGRVEIVDSPLPGRAIAICEKDPEAG